MKILENPADQFPSDINHAGGALQSVRSLCEGDGPVIAGQQASDDVEQGGFSRPGRPHQCDHLALFDVHVHTLEDLKFVGAGTERFGESFN